MQIHIYINGLGSRHFLCKPFTEKKGLVVGLSKNQGQITQGIEVRSLV